jgi:hypothetical protein
MNEPFPAVESQNIAQQMLAAVESAILTLITSSEEIMIDGRKYRRTDLNKLRDMRQKLYEEVFYANLSAGATTRAYAAWPLRKAGMPPWTSIGPWSNL